MAKIGKIEIPVSVNIKRKQVTTGSMKVTSIDEDERSVIAAISTDGIDRDSEILLPKGMDAEDFSKNPVVPWSHNTFEPPIGKAIWVKKGVKRITAKVKFATTERAEEVWQLFKGGFLKAFSVGFISVKSHTPTPEEIKKKPFLAEVRRIFDEWILLEFSPVTVPANPEALRLAMKNKTITISDELKEELELVEKEQSDCKIIEEKEEGINEDEFVKQVQEIYKKPKTETLVELNDEPEQPVKMTPIVDLQPIVELQPDIKGIASEAIKTRQGKMFIND